MLHLQQPYVQRRTLNPEPLVAELVPMPVNYRGFTPRLSPVTQEEMEEALYLSGLAEQQRREGAAS